MAQYSLLVETTAPYVAQRAVQIGAQCVGCNTLMPAGAVVWVHESDARTDDQPNPRCTGCMLRPRSVTRHASDYGPGLLALLTVSRLP